MKQTIEQFFLKKYKEGVREVTLNNEQLHQLLIMRANSPVMIPWDYPVFVDIKIKNFLK